MSPSSEHETAALLLYVISGINRIFFLFWGPRLRLFHKEQTGCLINTSHIIWQYTYNTHTTHPRPSSQIIFSSVSLFTYTKQESLFAFKKTYRTFFCFYLKVDPNDKQAARGSVGDVVTTWPVRPLPTEPHGCPAASVFNQNYNFLKKLWLQNTL